MSPCGSSRRYRNLGDPGSQCDTPRHHDHADVILRKQFHHFRVDHQPLRPVHVCHVFDVDVAGHDRQAHGHEHLALVLELLEVGGFDETLTRGQDPPGIENAAAAERQVELFLVDVDGRNEGELNDVGDVRPRYVTRLLRLAFHGVRQSRQRQEHDCHFKLYLEA